MEELRKNKKYAQTNKTTNNKIKQWKNKKNKIKQNT